MLNRSKTIQAQRLKHQKAVESYDYNKRRGRQSRILKKKKMNIKQMQ